MLQNHNVARKAVAVTPSDSEDLATVSQGLYITATGNVSFVCGGTTVTLTSVAANTFLPFAASRVLATGTTATVLALN